MQMDFKKIDDLSPQDFEFFVRDLFVLSGWVDPVITNVGKEYAHGDGGVDIFAYKNKRKFAIEVKQRKLGTTVNVDALNQLVTGGKLANASNMILVTNSYFSSEVQVRALRLGVELVDRDALKNLFVKKHSEIGREIKPRKYQQTVINECIHQYQLGKEKLLIEMATGLGKTYTAACIIKNIMQLSEKNIRVLFLAHHVEILLQSATSFKNIFGIGTYSFSACFAGSDPENTDFVFATFDTLLTKINVLKENHFDLIIVDEAHHSPARTYAEVVNYFHPRLLLGLTATPYRVDNKDVFAFFGGSDGHIGKYDLAWGLKHNRLAFPKYLVLLDDLDQTRLDQLEKGLSVSDLDKRLFLHKKDEEVIRIIEETILEKKINNPKGIVFCQNIQHMRYLINFFTIGTATLVHSQMKDGERRQNIRNFREGEYRFILVCDLFNEGIDIPETNILIFMRYTGSHTVWLQQLGRGLRKTPNKEYVHVLDFVGSLERLTEIHQLIKEVDSIAVDIDSLDEFPKEDHGIIHDSSLIVQYHKSAAQVLKLIQDLQYKLKSREQLIDKLRRFVESNEIVPEISNIENDLTDVTCDQIATHFDSYYRFLEIAAPNMLNKQAIADSCLNYANDYYKKYKVYPSMKAISNYFKHKNLLLISEPDIDELIGDKINVINEEKCLSQDEISEVYEQKSSPPPIAEYLISKYIHKINTPIDINHLTQNEKDEIKKEFNSLFYFLKILQSR
ncbi:TPA: DEAD/DEAH box helicase, partial [Legionella pneumophila]|nr:DEAD/DEAH box helicase [Legionella pneumophila]HAV0422705.1 DEAD/DEAH box helicase [Legionella pneumophila]HBI2941844.1 DEAD/DEAH box helicase family protein [Legionella pneumophila]